MDVIVIIEDDFELDFLPTSVNELASIWSSYISDQKLYNEIKIDNISKILQNFKYLPHKTFKNLQDLLDDNFCYIFNVKAAYLPPFDYELLSPEEAIQLPDAKKAEIRFKILKDKIKSFLENESIVTSA